MAERIESRLHAPADGQFLGCSGEMAEKMANFDWSRTSLGEPGQWPLSLQAVLRTALRSRFAMWMCWGPDRIFFCNDAYLPTLGVKGAWALGARATKVWEEIWSDIGPRIDRVLAEGISTWDEGLLLYLERSGAPEETYHTFSYSPLSTDDGQILGMLCVVAEETVRFIGERRVEFLGRFATELNAIASEPELLGRAERTLETHRHLVPFSAVYLVQENGRDMQLVAASGLSAAQRSAIALAPDSVWPMEPVITAQSTIVVEDVLARSGLALPTDQGLAVKKALLMPIAGQGGGKPVGIFVAGINPYHPFNPAYENFLRLLVGGLASGLASARAYDAERRRATELAELDRAKTEFFSNISHEFRTPLTLMLGPTEAALESDDAGLRGDDLGLVYRNELRLLKLVNSLLDFSKIEAGRFEIHREAIDITVFTSELVSLFQSAADHAGIALKLASDIVEPLLIDPDMWERVVLNLLSNALKHTQIGGISITLQYADGSAVLTVADTGCGIPAADLPHIFERFKRVHAPSRRSYEGTGIGLALIRELAELNGGDVQASSVVGYGSTFTVRIPAERAVDAPVSARALTVSAQAYATEVAQWAAPGVEPTREQQNTGMGDERPTILLADDNADMRSYIARLLAARFKVVTASDGLEALEVVRGRKPALVISDVMMPRMDGFGLLSAIRADANTAHTPVILISARAGEEARIEGIDAGADDYITKPFSAKEVVARVSGALALSRARQEASRVERRLRDERNEILESIADGFLLVERDWTIGNVNRAAEILLNAPRSEMVGRRIWDLFPAIENKPYGDSLRRSMQTRQPSKVENFYEPWNRWYEISVCPASSDALSLYFRDISEHKKMLQALHQADRMKDEFLATLAHELRNPLAPIRNAAEVLRSDKSGPREINWTSAVISRQVHHMSRLLDDLLDVSRITVGKMQIRIVKSALRDIMETAIETARPVIDARRHKLTIDLPKDQVLVNADPVRLAQVISNLLTNAAKYTDPGGHIVLSCTVESKTLRIEVRDNGIGMSAEACGRAFEMFSQAEQGMTRSQGGLGIGLALVKGIVELHGGTAEVHSLGIGQGSTFIVTLPIGRIDSADLHEEPGHRRTSACCRILIADDNRDAADSMAILLKMDGHEVRAVYDGASAITAAAEYRPQLAILDIGMPDMTGYEVAEQIRKQIDSAAPVHLIALTGYGQVEDQQRAWSAGFNNHLTKPVELERLRLIIHDAAARGGSS